MSTSLVVLSCIISIFALMSIGGNDVANSQATAVGSGALSLRGAQILAAICEFAGAALVGQQVSNTIGSKMVDNSALTFTELQYCWGMFSGLFSVGIWMIIATAIKMPVSATHSIIGALFGLNLVMTHWNWNSADWPVLGKIAIAWIVTPLLSFAAAYVMLAALNIYWPSDGERDEELDRESQSAPDVEVSNTQRSSLILFAMAPVSDKLAAKPSPGPKKPGAGANVRLTWAAANEADAGNVDKVPKSLEAIDEQKEKPKEKIGVGIDIVAPTDDVEEEHVQEEVDAFEPQKFKFALVFGILMATLVIFLLIGGPRSINIEDGAIEVDDWVIVVIAFGSLFLFIVIGYLIEDCYRKYYIKWFLKDMEAKEEVELAEEANKGDITPPAKDKDDDVAIDTDAANQESAAGKEETPSKTPEKEKGKDKGKAGDERTDTHQQRLSFNNQDYFRVYVVVSAGAVAFAHGGNDVANVLGPFGQIWKYVTTDSIEGDVEIPIYVAGLAGLCIAAGFALFGAPVLETIGKSITKLSFRSGFTAQFSAAGTVLICNVLGLPVSSSTVIVGGVSGVGYYNSRQRKARMKSKNKNNIVVTKEEEEEVEYVGFCNKLKYLWGHQNIRVLCKILAIWIITIPANAFITGCTYAFINLFL